jgi:hypothetical protein
MLYIDLEHNRDIQGYILTLAESNNADRVITHVSGDGGLHYAGLILIELGKYLVEKYK